MVKSESDFQAHVAAIVADGIARIAALDAPPQNKARLSWKADMRIAAFPGRRCGWNPWWCSFAERGSFDAFFGVGTCVIGCPIWTPALCETTALYWLDVGGRHGASWLVYPEHESGWLANQIFTCPAVEGACSC